MARYKILIADPLLGMGLVFPEGCSLVRQMEQATAGMHWHLLDDPEAPPELEGREVRLVMKRDGDGSPVIAGRHLVVTHLADREEPVLRCCEIAPWDVPYADHVTYDPQSATCEGSRAARLDEAAVA